MLLLLKYECISVFSFLIFLNDQIYIPDFRRISIRIVASCNLGERENIIVLKLFTQPVEAFHGEFIKIISVHCAGEYFVVLLG